jgi:hypothetical protein
MTLSIVSHVAEAIVQNHVVEAAINHEEALEVRNQPRCGWFYVSCVFRILEWMCMLSCVGSVCLPIWFDHFILQSGWKVCDLYHFLRLRELCLSHPSVDVDAHLCVKWMLTYMV